MTQAAEAELPIVIRPMAPGDRNFVRKSWLRSNHASDMARFVGRAYWSEHHDLIDRLMERGRVLVACSATHAPTIVGWACVEGIETLHYVYVREEFRRYGVARRLCATLPETTVCSHRPDVVNWTRVPAGWRFSLYALMQ